MTQNQPQLKQTSLGLTSTPLSAGIPEDWEIYSVDEISEVVGGGTPSTKDTNNFNGSIPWITPKDLSNYQNRYISL